MEGTGGREHRTLGVGEVREAGGERVGSGIPKVAGARKKGENFVILHNISQ